MRCNKKAFLLSLLWCFCLLDAIAQRTVLGHIIDAETKESMPYVSIYLGPNRGSITNNDGDFLIEVLDDDEAIISFVGYEKQKIKAASLGGTIKLKPFKKVLREVVVQAIEPDFLKDIITFYNNQRNTPRSISAEGQTANGKLLWGNKY